MSLLTFNVTGSFSSSAEAAASASAPGVGAYTQPLTVALYFSGGAANAAHAASIGGAKSSVAASGSMFGSVAPAQFQAGVSLYRCLYAQVGTPVNAIRAYIQSDTPASDTVIALGWGVAAANGTETAVANETTAPAGVTFVSPSTLAAGPSKGSLSTNQWVPLWLRYVASAGAAAKSSEAFSIEIADPGTWDNAEAWVQSEAWVN